MIERLLRIAGVLTLAVLLPGCIDIPVESKALIAFFVVVLSLLIVLNAFLIVLLLFYFLPFTKPKRKRKRR